MCGKNYFFLFFFFQKIYFFKKSKLFLKFLFFLISIFYYKTHSKKIKISEKILIRRDSLRIILLTVLGSRGKNLHPGPALVKYNDSAVNVYGNKHYYEVRV